MCSYNGENGHPSCANSWLLNDVVRGMWNQTDALITTDCGAVANLRHYPANAPNNMVAASWAINNGEFRAIVACVRVLGCACGVAFQDYGDRLVSNDVASSFNSSFFGGGRGLANPL